jgi:hypothetical protein
LNLQAPQLRYSLPNCPFFGGESVNAIADRPSIQELDELSDLAAGLPIDRRELVAALRQIEDGLREHGRSLDQAGGLLDEEERAARMSLAREDERLRFEVSTLLRNVEAIRRTAVHADEGDLRRRLTALAAGLRGHRDAEARLVLESTETEIGSGD